MRFSFMRDFARVITDLALDRAFDYAVPPELRGRIEMGHRVRVPFGSRQTTGYVVEFPDMPATPKLKTILDLVDATPLVQPELIHLARWMAEYYICAFETALKAVLPEAVRREDASHRERLEACLIREPTVEEMAVLHRRAPTQAAALLTLKEHGPVLLSQAKKIHASTATLRALSDKGFVEIRSVRSERDPFQMEQFVASEPLQLNDEQRIAFAEIERHLDAKDPKPMLLHGVTGSGKTELYLQAIAHCLDRGQGAIVLVPEIALTPQSVERFKSRYLGRTTGVAVLHSHLSTGERHDEWHKIRDGRAQVVIGARSAVFAPVRNLGLIVVDEEHEPSYKQQEAPRYHARDVAVVRARFEKAAVLLGSATPALESYHNSRTGKYTLLTLEKRVDFQQMPVVHVVDMRKEVAQSKGRGIPVVSRLLADAIRARLERKEQVILFLNRRGFAASIQCLKCGYVPECIHCSVSLTYHQARKRLLCHFCDHEAPAPERCPECSDPSIRYGGAGTEKVEMVIQKLFPQAVIARMDSDTMTRKSSYRDALGAFRTGKTDILVGTQMIAKGLHFPNVTLVGIIHADLALHLPDFRASERVFQLLTQVSGRAGRGDVSGEVFVQSFTPHHPSIQYARRHQFVEFFEEELGFRKEIGYPPFQRAVLLVIRSMNEQRASLVADAIAHALKGAEMPGLVVQGPAPASIAKIDRHYRFHLFLKHPGGKKAAQLLRREVFERKREEGVDVTIDVDPLDLL